MGQARTIQPSGRLTEQEKRVIEALAKSAARADYARGQDSRRLKDNDPARTDLRPIFD